MSLNWKVFERTERVELGTIESLLGKGGSIKLSPRNINDESKRVALILQKKDGTSDTVVCSSRVSELLRAKEIKLSQVVGFPVIEQENKAGEIINLVAMPSGASNVVEIAIAKLKVTDYEPEFTVQDIESLVAV